MAHIFYPSQSISDISGFDVIGGSVFYAANDYDTAPIYISDDIINRESSAFQAKDGMEGTKWELYSQQLTTEAAWFFGAKQVAFLDFNYGTSPDSTPDITHVAIGDGNAINKCESFTITATSDNFATVDVMLYDSSVSGLPPTTDKGSTVFALTTTGTTYDKYRIIFYNVSTDAVLGNVMLGKVKELLYQTRPITLPVANLSKQLGYAGGNFLALRTKVINYKTKLTIRNLSKAQLADYEELLDTKGTPLIWVADGEEYSGGYMAFMYRTGTDTPIVYNSNNLLDLSITMTARKW
tara:strand:- start:1445 stop:2329 length:885 start_codon:yes stop_codon:yes gene_type:complete